MVRVLDFLSTFNVQKHLKHFRSSYERYLSSAVSTINSQKSKQNEYHWFVHALIISEIHDKIVLAKWLKHFVVVGKVLLITGKVKSG